MFPLMLTVLSRERSSGGVLGSLIRTGSIRGGHPNALKP